MATTRIVPLVVCASLLFGSCGGGETSLTEYVDEINVHALRAGERGAALIAEAEQITDFTPQHLQAGLERGLNEIRLPLQEAVDAMEAPDQISDLHSLLWDWHESLIATETALATRAASAQDTAAGWATLSSSPEMAAYRQALAEGKRICRDFQAELDATAERGEFLDTPWVPAQLSEVVHAALGCEWFPEDPDSLYRYP